MPNAPKCLDCLNQGRIGQTYKKVSFNGYKCQSCSKVYPADKFEAIDLQWFEKPEEWRKHITAKLKEPGKRRVEEIMKQVEAGKK